MEKCLGTVNKGKIRALDSSYRSCLHRLSVRLLLGPHLRNANLSVAIPRHPSAAVGSVASRMQYGLGGLAIHHSFVAKSAFEWRDGAQYC
jgi:hypothetical protein